MITKDERKALADMHTDFKAKAALADKARTVEEPVDEFVAGLDAGEVAA